MAYIHANAGFRHNLTRFTPPGEDVEVPERRMPMPKDQAGFCGVEDAFRGIWHGQPEFFPEFGPKYGGGLGTYPYQTRPMALYAAAVEKTFFCWGGTSEGSSPLNRCWDFGPGGLLHMVSAYDHRSGRLEAPIRVFDKWCADPHDNPALQIDAEGFLWLFSPSHGEWTTRSFIHRSTRPYDHRSWETISDGPLFAYPQPWHDPRFGWMFPHTEYHHGRGLRFKSSPDGRLWSPSRPLADFGAGHYQVSRFDTRSGSLGTAFDYHPPEGGLDHRTNLYFMLSADGGASWHSIEGQPLTLPLDTIGNPCLVHDYAREGKVVYLRDLVFTEAGEPVILFVTSRGYEPGPQNAPHAWNLARWRKGKGWDIHVIFQSDNNYDHGELWLGPDDWRIIAPTDPGPQPWNPGGDVVLWISRDEGARWEAVKCLTHDSLHNHTFCRRPLNAHPDFHCFWAEGHAREPSASALYFCDKDGNRVQRMAPANDSGRSCLQNGRKLVDC